MRISSLQNQNSRNQNFNGFIAGKKAGNFVLKKSEKPIFDTLSFLTATTSMLGFAVGGSGLTSDWINDLSTKKNIKNNDISKDTKKSPFDSIATRPIQKKDDGGAKTIVPGTAFSKIGLKFAKVGIAFSGIAGIFNGISMGLPLMSLGETLNLCSSPIIETPLGTGLFGIALSFVFSGRALEKDPMLKMDSNTLHNKKGLVAKAGYVVDNMLGCAKSVLSTGKQFAVKTTKLFNSDKAKRLEGLNFYRDNVFTFKPKKIVVQEFLNHEGKVVLKTTFQNNPYLMHAASIVLAKGGTTLAISSLINKKKGQKVGLKTYETGGSLDNLSLSRTGVEKFITARTLPEKVSGALQSLCGVTICSGQPGVDEKWGRGIQWVGTALLFAVFAVERFPKAFKLVKEKALPESLIRQWEVDLTKLYSRDELKQTVKVGDKETSRLNTIIKDIVDGNEITDERLNKVVSSIRNVVGDGKNGFDSKTNDIKLKLIDEMKKNNSNLTDENIAEFFKYDGKEFAPDALKSKAEEIVNDLKTQVAKEFATDAQKA